MGNSPFDEEMQKEIYTNEYSIPEPTVKSTEAVFAMGRDGDTTEINEEIKKEIEKRRKRILDELKKKNKDAEKE